MALTVSQYLEAEQEIRRRAEEKNVPILFIQDVKSALLEFVDSSTFESIPLENRENAALAAQITHKFLQDRGYSLNGLDVKAGLKNCRWPGRFDIINSNGFTWYLDGAHNETSIEVVAKWYERMSDVNTTKERLNEYAQLWQDDSPSCSIHKAKTVAEGIDKAREFGTETNILVTGSLYLVEAARKTVSM
ncbi:hypothetical protein N7478_012234 [Penicillium angulare]|uniref:uncharacterized protein n=1 Tax=Penicillium angulare TaxID=116970 RepID=UPI00254235BC|nr:uncharacterized protein N7478_012234 [Penicillium angulare]KAJ5259253.1 hypothetical protein N7478_012234 [Penicillium angulare]